MTDRIYNVLFLCTVNSACSILAESIPNGEAKGRLKAYSAGSQPQGEGHPLALDTLRSFGYEMTGFSSKSRDVFAEPGPPQMDFVFTVCGNADGQACPVWVGHPTTAHWSVVNPGVIEGSLIEHGRAFSHAARFLKNRITAFLSLPLESIGRLALEIQLGSIGRMEGSASPRGEVA